MPRDAIDRWVTRSPLDHTGFRHALSFFPTGVAIVTVTCGDRRSGLTVSSFNSVSLDPPLILWSLARTAPSFPLFRDSEFFGVNILAEDQEPLAHHFTRPHPDKLAGVPHAIDYTGTPLLDGCSVHLLCRTWNRLDGGDHVIMLGEVLELSASGRRPLVFARGNFCRLRPDP